MKSLKFLFGLTVLFVLMLLAAHGQNTNPPGILSLGGSGASQYYGLRYRPGVANSNATISTNFFFYIAGAISNTTVKLPLTTSLADGQSWQIKNTGTNTVTLQTQNTNHLFDASSTNLALAPNEGVTVTKHGTNFWTHFWPSPVHKTGDTMTGGLTNNSTAGFRGNGTGLTNVNAALLGNNPASAFATTGSVVSITQKGSVYQVPVVLDFTNKLSVIDVGHTNANVSKYGFPSFLTVSNTMIDFRGEAIAQAAGKQLMTNDGTNLKFVGVTDTSRYWTNNGSYWEYYTSGGSLLKYTNSTLIDPLGVFDAVAGNGARTNAVVFPVASSYSQFNGAPVGGVTNWIATIGSSATNNTGNRGFLMIPFVFVTAVGGQPIAKVTITQAGIPAKLTKTLIFSTGGTNSFSPVTNWVSCGFVNQWSVVTPTDVSTGSGASVTIAGDGATLELP